jgi:hypothetical protein
MGFRISQQNVQSQITTTAGCAATGSPSHRFRKKMCLRRLRLTLKRLSPHKATGLLFFSLKIALRTPFITETPLPSSPC